VKRAEGELMLRREELFEHYKKVCGFFEIKNIKTGEIERVYAEDYKRRWGGCPPLLSILPKLQKCLRRPHG